MRKMSVLAAVLLFASAAAASDKVIHKTAALDPTGHVSVDTHNGSITVATWNRPQVDIQARVESTFDTSQADVNATDVRVTGSGSSVDISTDYSGVEGWTYRTLGIFSGNITLPPMHYTITVPASAHVKLTTHNADTHVRGLRGDLDISTHNGEIDVTDLDGTAHLESHNGTVHVAFARFSHAAEIQTHNGSIEVQMPQSAAFRIDADGHHLDFNSDFPATTRGYDSSRFTGDVNGGGPALRISTHNGSVRVRKS